MSDIQKNPASETSPGYERSRLHARLTARLEHIVEFRRPHLMGGLFAGMFAVVGASILLFSYAATPPAPTPVAKVVIHSGVTSAHQQLCLDDYQNQNANGTPEIGFPCNTTDPAQQWTLYSNGTIRIHDTECLDTAAPFNQPGSKAITYVCNDAKSQTQVWVSSATALSSGISTELVNGDTPNLCLTEPKDSASGIQLEVATCTPNSGQEWAIQQYQRVTAVTPGVATLQTMYNNTAGSPSRGLFCSGKPDGSCWWDSANELNDIISYTEQTGDQQYVNDIATTYANAGHDLGGVSSYPFIDRYNDDDGWWGLTWINAYQLTGNRNYLQAAENIFAYIQSNGWTSSCGGGVFQFNDGVGADGLPATKDAIANGLYVTLAARLYQATGSPAYLSGPSGAEAAANWFLGSGLIVSSGPQAGLIEDHLINPATVRVGSSTGSSETTGSPLLGATCQAANSQKSTYNQGMVLGGLADLYSITGDSTYLRAAQKTANAVLTDTQNTSPPLIDSNGVLTEPCNGAPYNCDLSTAQSFLQWKGPFVRSLYCLNSVAPVAAYTTFFGTNANAILTTYKVGQPGNPAPDVSARNIDYFGFTWDRYTAAQIGPATQGSALDAIEANMGGSTRMCVG